MAVPALFLLATCLYLISASALVKRRSALPTEKRQVFQLPGATQHDCVAWRQTNFCSPYGCACVLKSRCSTDALDLLVTLPPAGCRTRAPSADRGCSAAITTGPGFCECSGRITVRRCAC